MNTEIKENGRLLNVVRFTCLLFIGLPEYCSTSDCHHHRPNIVCCLFQVSTPGAHEQPKYHEVITTIRLGMK